MRLELKKVLNQLNEIDFIELQHHLNLAAVCRELLKKHDLSIAELALKMTVTKQQLTAMVKGVYPFDLRTISKIEAIRRTLEADLAGKRLESIISFPDFKYSKKEESKQ